MHSLFVSPVLDMKQLIQKMMGWVGVTEEALQQKKRLRQRLGKLCLGSITKKAHPIVRWACPTSILYAGQDHLTARWEVDAFAARFHCALTVLEDGEHWFHTAEQLKFLRKWTDSHI